MDKRDIHPYILSENTLKMDTKDNTVRNRNTKHYKQSMLYQCVYCKRWLIPNAFHAKIHKTKMCKDCYQHIMNSQVSKSVITNTKS